jgi:hypothetical protein
MAEPSSDTLKTTKLVVRLLAVLGLLLAGGFFAERATKIAPRDRVWFDARMNPDGHGGFTLEFHHSSGYELDRKITALVNYEAADSAGIVAHLIFRPSEAKEFLEFVSEERALWSVIGSGAVADGYVLGLISEPEMETAECDRAIHDPQLLKSIRSEKMKALRARNDAETALGNLAVAYEGDTPSPEAQALSQSIQNQLAQIYALNPEFTQIPH